MKQQSKSWLRSLLAAALLGGVATAALAADYAPVTDERLKNPEPQNWLSWRGNYASWGYSPLDQINADNVKGLVPVWSYSTGLIEGHQAPPLVNNGIGSFAISYFAGIIFSLNQEAFFFQFNNDLFPGFKAI